MIYTMLPLCKNPSAIIGFKITNNKPLQGLINTTSDEHGIKIEEFEEDGNRDIITPSYYISKQTLFQFMFDNGCMDAKGLVLKDNLNCNDDKQLV